MLRILSFSLSLFLFCFTCQTHAQTELDPFSQGKYYFFQKDYEKAYLSFHQSFMEDPTNLNISFFMGRAAFEHAMISRAKGDEETAQRRLESALMAFDRVLIIQPGAVRVKLEMARCHAELGALEIAKQHFYEVLASNPPESVKKNIEFLLAAIASTEKRHFFSGMASLGVSFDDNVRSGPPAGTVTLQLPQWPNLGPFLADAPVRDQILSTTILANHIYKIPETPYSWKSSATLFNNLYESFKDLDLSMVGVSTGPAYQGERVMLDANVHINNIKLGWDEYVQPFGIGASLTYLLDPHLIISSSFALEKKIYAKSSDDLEDATNFVLNFSPSLILGDNRFTFSLTKEQENAEAAYWCYSKLSWGIRYDRVLPYDFTAFLSYDNKSTDYDEANTALTDTEPRSDKVQQYTGGLSKIFWQSKNKSQNLALQLTHTVTDANSNIERSNYNKKVFASSMSYTF
jgi:tetratricopeptide (TPR) repeat protein